MLKINGQQCAGLESLRREWIVTNGLGGYASATVSGANSRRYHGLLVAALDPPGGRTVLLSKLEETLIFKSNDRDDERIDLSMNVFGESVLHPRGDERQTGFRVEIADGSRAVFTYEVKGITLEKTVRMVQGENTTVVEYRMASQGEARDVTLELRPLIAFKDFHHCKHEEALDPSVQLRAGAVRLKPYADLPELWLAHEAEEVIAHGSWYKNFGLLAEKERGLDWQEDLYNPLTLRGKLVEGKAFAVVASVERRSVAEVTRPSREAGRIGHPASVAAVLERAAEQFIVARPPFKTVIAGYHWFGDWGRDTMISLPGLLLSLGKTDECRDILLEFNKYVSEGMLPNRFPDHGEEPEYNTVDATLWYFEALWKYVHAKPDAAWRKAALQLVKVEFYPKLKSIIALHLSGTRYGIHADQEGFLWAGNDKTQLTWMDARVAEVAITPRAGRPVEIQALWFNALLVMRDFAREFGEGDEAAQYAGVAMKLQTHFLPVFWNEAEQCLYDVAGGDGWVDGAVRPNMAIALGLTHCLLDAQRARSVLRMVEQDLLTPFGLRTLSPRDSRYKARYGGDVWSRDSAYHQGTVWPWLIGPYFTAKLRFGDDRAGVVAEIGAWLKGFAAHFDDAGVGTVSEIFDGDAPWEPKGCIAQAWSVAELLRLAKLAGARD